jgi:hypothetical protein
VNHRHDPHTHRTQHRKPFLFRYCRWTPARPGLRHPTPIPNPASRTRLRIHPAYRMHWSNVPVPHFESSLYHLAHGSENLKPIMRRQPEASHQLPVPRTVYYSRTTASSRETCGSGEIDAVVERSMQALFSSVVKMSRSGSDAGMTPKLGCRRIQPQDSNIQTYVVVVVTNESRLPLFTAAAAGVRDF